MAEHHETEELRVIIRPSDTDGKSRLIPAILFKKAFSTFLAALKAADKEIGGKAFAHDFFVADLRMGSNEFAFCEIEKSTDVGKNSAIGLLKKITQAVYRSDFDTASKYIKLSKSIVGISKIFDPRFTIVAKFSETDEIPIDGFFQAQAERLSNTVISNKTKPRFFAGNAIGAFDGRLGNIDYRGLVWTGNLLLQGSEVQIQCIFDRSRGEDHYNPFGNKRVSITGRAIYTGDSQLPERLEVMSMEQLDLPSIAIDFRGTITNRNYQPWEDGLENIK